MAQHQLMLLVLTIIITGVALVLGVTTYTQDQKKFERDAANTILLDLAGKAIAYRRTSEAMNGGTRSNGTSSFDGFRMESVGATPGNNGGYDLLGDGSCFTGHATPDGSQFKAAWYPNGDCDSSSNVVLKMTITGDNLESVTMEDGGYANAWRQGQ